MLAWQGQQQGRFRQQAQQRLLLRETPVSRWLQRQQRWRPPRLPERALQAACRAAAPAGWLPPRCLPGSGTQGPA